MNQGTAILVGATGLVGGHCVELLTARYSSVVVLGRRRGLEPRAGLTEHRIDFDKLGDSAHLLTAEDVFCCLGTTIKAAGSRAAFARVDRDYVVRLAELALAGGAGRFFLVSALGADARSSVFYNRIKGETENAVAALPFRAVHIVRPSLLLGDRRDSRPAERMGQIAARVIGPLMIGPLSRYRAVAAARVAATLVACADSSARGLHVHYPSTSVSRPAPPKERAP